MPSNNHARNRKLPPDHVIRAHLDAGLSQSDIARLYETTTSTVSHYCRVRGWHATADASGMAPVRQPLRESATKVIVATIDGPVSLPRIPVLHGHFAAALPSVTAALPSVVGA